MRLEMVISLIAATLTAVVGAFGLGKPRSANTTKTKADKQRTEECVIATEAVTERRVETTKGARDVQQAVNHLPDHNVDHELCEKFIHKT